MVKEIHVRIGPGEDAISLEEMQQIIEDLQEKYPDREVFFDGDEYAICSRKRHH